MAPINPTPTPTPTPTPIPTREFLLCLISTPPPSSMTTTSAAAPSSCKFNKRLKTTPTVSKKVDLKPPKCDPESDHTMERKGEMVSSTNGTNHDSLSKETNIVMKYKECRKNHAASIGGYAVDGCREFMAAGEEGTAAAFECAACGCHRNFHRKEVDQCGDCYCDCSSISATTKY